MVEVSHIIVLIWKVPAVTVLMLKTPYTVLVISNILTSEYCFVGDIFDSPEYECYNVGGLSSQCYTMGEPQMFCLLDIIYLRTLYFAVLGLAVPTSDLTKTYSL